MCMCMCSVRYFILGVRFVFAFFTRYLIYASSGTTADSHLFGAYYAFFSITFLCAEWVTSLKNLFYFHIMWGSNRWFTIPPSRKGQVFTSENYMTLRFSSGIMPWPLGLHAKKIPDPVNFTRNYYATLGFSLEIITRPCGFHTFIDEVKWSARGGDGQPSIWTPHNAPPMKVVASIFFHVGELSPYSLTFPKIHLGTWSSQKINFTQHKFRLMTSFCWRHTQILYYPKMVFAIKVLKEIPSTSNLDRSYISLRSMISEILVKIRRRYVIWRHFLNFDDVITKSDDVSKIGPKIPL